MEDDEDKTLEQAVYFTDQNTQPSISLSVDPNKIEKELKFTILSIFDNSDD